jgi:hypothetical protein
MKDLSKELSKELINALSEVRNGLPPAKFLDFYKKSKIDVIDDLVKKYNLQLGGAKPDAYLVPRNGRLNLEFSYHSMKRAIFEEYGITCHTFTITKKMYDAGVIKKIDPIAQTIELDFDAYTKLITSEDGSHPEDTKFVVVCMEGKDKVVQHIVSISTISGISNDGLHNRFVTKIRDKVGVSKNRHFLEQMLKKTAIKHVIRENFINVLPGIDQDDDEEGYKQSSPKEESTESAQPAENEVSEEELKQLKQDLEQCSEKHQLAAWFKKNLDKYPESLLKELGKKRKDALAEVR